MALLVQKRCVNHDKPLCLSSFQADFGRIYSGPCQIPAGPQNNIASPQNIMAFLIAGVKILFQITSLAYLNSFQVGSGRVNCDQH